MKSVSDIVRLSPSQAMPSSRTSPIQREIFSPSATAFVEIVIARAEDDAGYARQQRQVFFHHQDLGAEIDHRSDVERVAGENDDVEFRRSSEQPVELRQ